jgi:hypothetical protein
MFPLFNLHKKLSIIVPFLSSFLFHCKFSFSIYYLTKFSSVIFFYQVLELSSLVIFMFFFSFLCIILSKYE